MSDFEHGQESRRDFLRKAGKAAVAAPAVALLVSANVKQAGAQAQPYGTSGNDILTGGQGTD